MSTPDNTLFPEIDPQSQSASDVPDWRPAVDIGENISEYLLVVEMPGIKHDQIQISCDQDRLNISCEAEMSSEEQLVHLSTVERNFGTGQRMFQMPDDANSPALRWFKKNGLVHIHIPKAVPAIAQLIEVSNISEDEEKDFPVSIKQTSAIATAS
jgi:HSP20 family protein